MVEAQSQLPIVDLVLFIACGVLAFFLIFIFAKRQIYRFALKTSRKPHIYIGTDATIELKLEIERRLDRTHDIKYQPNLHNSELHGDEDSENHYYFRMKAIDAIQLLKNDLITHDSTIHRRSNGSITKWLLDMRTGPLKAASGDLIVDFIQAYNHARHNPMEFGAHEYNRYMMLLRQLQNIILQSPKKDTSSINIHKKERSKWYVESSVDDSFQLQSTPDSQESSELEKQTLLSGTNTLLDTSNSSAEQYRRAKKQKTTKTKLVEGRKDEYVLLKTYNQTRSASTVSLNSKESNSEEVAV